MPAPSACQGGLDPVDEAHERFRQMVGLIETVPRCADDAFLADLVLNWMRVFYYRKDFKGMVTLAERYLPRVEALGDMRRLSLLRVVEREHIWTASRLLTIEPSQRR